MEIILLKSSICLLAFIAFYKVILEQTSNHHFKRIYLLGVILVSIVIPFITFVEYIEPQTVLNNFTGLNHFSETQNLTLQKPTNYLPIVLWSIYGLGVLLFLVRFIYNLSGILLKIKRNPKQKASNFISVLLKDLIIPHTFFSYIFLNKTAFENNQIPNEVLLHEQTHAKQKHSLDILFIELLQIVFWFHPLVYILKKDIKLNHEFLADQAVLNQGVESISYQKTLLSFSSNKQELTLEHAINYSSIKKRFTVMKTKTSKQTLWLRSLLVLPLLAILIFSFSTKEQVTKNTSLKTEIFQENIAVSDNINIYITKDLKLFVNDRSTSLKTLQKTLNQFNRNLTLNEKKENTVVEIELEDNIEMGFLTDVKAELRKYGYSKISIIYSNINQIETPKLVILENPLQLLLNGELTNLKNLKGDFTKITKGEASDLIIDLTNTEEIKYSFVAKIKNTIKEKIKTIHLNGAYYSVDKESNKISIIKKTQESATPEQIEEYNKLASYYNKGLRKKESIQILLKDKTRLEYIYSLMSDTQKQKAEPFPNFPPIPPSPIVKKGEVSNIPPPPPKAPKVKKGEISNIPPPPPKAPKVKKGEISNIPPPPPPRSPLDHVIHMAKEDAAFYYDGKKISSDEAITILKKDEELNISTQTKDLKQPIVNITTSPVITDNNGKIITKIEKLQDVKSNTKNDKNGYVDINGTTYSYSVKNNKITYYNRYGKKVNEKGELLN